MIFEHTYEATVDADIIPDDTRGTRTGVFTGMCFFDSDISLFHRKLDTGCNWTYHVTSMQCINLVFMRWNTVIGLSVVDNAIMRSSVRGDLSTICWIEEPITKDYQNENLISIYYATLNFKDVMLLMGEITLEVDGRKDINCVIGFEYSGINISVRRIMDVNCSR
uniref:Uncharacterized protein n=1 Tax=Vespula pensylvanica TaxID=30213 RepID=A0A834UCJ4_VESPE|nr:hypothetical protein H0235_004464 [Vespula pensylvanica]